MGGVSIVIQVYDGPAAKFKKTLSNCISWGTRGFLLGAAVHFLSLGMDNGRIQTLVIVLMGVVGILR